MTPEGSSSPNINVRLSESRNQGCCTQPTVWAEGGGPPCRGSRLQGDSEGTLGRNQGSPGGPCSLPHLSPSREENRFILESVNPILPFPQGWDQLLAVLPWGARSHVPENQGLGFRCLCLWTCMALLCAAGSTVYRPCASVLVYLGMCIRVFVNTHLLCTPLCTFIHV